MEPNIKGIIDSIDQKDKSEAMLERKIEALKEEINRLKFTIREQKLLIQSLKEANSGENDVILDDDIQLLKEMIFSQRQEILKKDEQIQELQKNDNKIHTIAPLFGDSNQFDEEIERLHKKIDNLNNQLDLYKSNENNAKKIIEELSEQVEISNKELKKMHSHSQKHEWEKIKKKKSREKDKLIEMNNTLKLEIKEYQSQVLNLQQSLESIENASRIEREKNNSIIEQLSLQNDEKKVELDHLKEKMSFVENPEFKNEIMTNIHDYYELEKFYENQMKKLESENNAFQIELDSLRTQIREFKKSEFDSTERQEHLDVMKSSEIIKSLENENNELRESLSQLNAENMELRERNIFLEEAKTNRSEIHDDDEVSSIIGELKQENQQLSNENKEIKTQLSVKLSDEAELKQIIEDLKIQNHKLKTKIEVEILEKEFEIPKEAESQLYKRFLNSLDHNSIQNSINNLIKNVYSDKSYNDKKNSLYVLATIKDDKVKNLFSKLIMHKDWLIRFHLIKAIEKARDLEYKEFLVKLSIDKDVDVREAAKDVLSKL